jgi:hypothetical protein
MKCKIRMAIGSATLAGTMLLLTAVGAQQRAAVVSSRPAYDATHEIVLQGMVVSYTEDSSRPPMGAHVTVQTASGAVDVHLGPASYLRSNHFSLATGESVWLVGVSIPTRESNVFLARLARHGTQAIALRSPNGFLLANSAARGLLQTERAPSARQSKPR